MRAVKLSIFILFAIIRNGFAANILGLMGCASRSHHLWNEVLFSALAERGHTLTIASIDISAKHHENIRYIHLEETHNHLDKFLSNLTLPTGPISNVQVYYFYQILTCEGMLKSKGFEETLMLGESFDLILYDLVGGPCLLKFVTKYPRVPVVAVSAYKINPELLHIAGGHIYPAYIPLISNELDLPMNYWERLYNTGTYALSEYYRKYVADKTISEMVSERFSDDNTSMDDLYKRINIFLTNTHPALDFTQPLPPNVIEVAGLNIKEPKPMPMDIDKFMNSAKDGAVFISLGTNIRMEMLGEENIKHFVNVIKRFSNFNFLWKVDKPDWVKNPPKNLLMRKWFSQNDILGHPNLKAFFTHAGGLSTHEASWHGVPVVAMPFFIDQFRNARRIKELNLGTVVDLKTLTENTLYQSLSAVLTGDEYRNSMKAMQTKFRDLQNKPLDTAVWWVEYALRSPDLSHLVPDARHLSYFVANSIDVLLTVFVLMLVFLVILWKVLKNLKKYVLKEKKTNKAQKSTTKKKEN